MREEYDFTAAEKNPYVRPKKQTVTLRLDAATVAYFKELSTEVAMPYQTLINSFLTDCMRRKVKPSVQWSK